MRLLYALAIIAVASGLPASAQIEGLQRDDVVRMGDPSVLTIVRRIIALPGDEVRMNASGEIYVNDVLVQDVPSQATDRQAPFGAQVVPEESYMVVPLTDSERWNWGLTHQSYIIERIG